jgi:hypothetical protein
MSEVPKESIEIFQTGNILEFNDLTELVTFEDTIAFDVDPDLDLDLWACRVNLREFMKPPKFNGRLINIKLVVMEKPYDRLLDANERGWSLQSTASSAGVKITDPVNQQHIIPKMRGFVFVADASSSKGGVISQVQAEMWYYPLPLNIANAGVTKHGSYTLKDGTVAESFWTTKTARISDKASPSAALRRVITRPKTETDKFIEHDEAARRIGFSVLRNAK